MTIEEVLKTTPTANLQTVAMSANTTPDEVVNELGLEHNLITEALQAVHENKMPIVSARYLASFIRLRQYNLWQTACVEDPMTFLQRR